MVEQLGVVPSFDPRSIKDFLVRGYVYSALHFALQQKVPSQAVKDFSRDLGKLEPSEFEKKYGVPSARLRHQLRPKNADWLVKRARWELRRLEEDLSSAENYWNNIFEHVTKKYFKNREKDVLNAVENSRWYPYLEVLEMDVKRTLSKRDPDISYLSGYSTICVLPTDKKQRERFTRLTTKADWLKIKHPQGWVYLREIFCLIDDMNCVLIENMQKPKMIGRHPFKLPRLPKEVEQFRNEDKNESTMDLRNQLMELSLCVSMSNIDGVRRVPEVLYNYEVAMQMLEKEAGLKGICDALGVWAHNLQKELQQQLPLHSPQPFYPINFLPAFLTSIYFMEKNCPEKMSNCNATVIDLQGVNAAKAYAIGRGLPKELEEYMKIIEVLGAKKIGEHLYLAKFSS